MAISASRSPWWRFIAAAALAIWMNWWVRSPIQAHWSGWLILLAQLAVLLGLALPAAPEPLPVAPKKPSPVARKKVAEGSRRS